jgi:hypothetical protein
MSPESIVTWSPVVRRLRFYQVSVTGALLVFCENCFEIRNRMRLYHGTSKKVLAAITREGVEAPSYWGTQAQASEYAKSFGDQRILLTADLDEQDLSASLYMAQAMVDEGDLDTLPDSSDLVFSLEYLGGVTCQERVMQFEVMEKEPVSKPSRRPARR